MGTNGKPTDPFTGLVLSTSEAPSRSELEALFTCAGFPTSVSTSLARAPLFAATVRRAVDARLVAYTSLHAFADGEALEWTDLAVDPEFRTRGIGTALGNLVVEETQRLLATRQQPWLRLYAKPRRGLADRYKRKHGFQPADGGDLLVRKFSARG